MTQRSSAAPPLFGFRVGEVAQLHQGWGGRITPVRIVGPGSGGTSLAVDPTDPSVRPPRGADVDVWNLMHDTSAFRAWAVLWERSLNERALDPGRDRGAYLCALRRATEALIVENRSSSSRATRVKGARRTRGRSATGPGSLRQRPGRRRDSSRRSGPSPIHRSSITSGGPRAARPRWTRWMRRGSRTRTGRSSGGSHRVAAKTVLRGAGPGRTPRADRCLRVLRPNGRDRRRSELQGGVKPVSAMASVAARRSGVSRSALRVCSSRTLRTPGTAAIRGGMSTRSAGIGPAGVRPDCSRTSRLRSSATSSGRSWRRSPPAAFCWSLARIGGRRSAACSASSHSLRQRSPSSRLDASVASLSPQPTTPGHTFVMSPVTTSRPPWHTPSVAQRVEQLT